MLGGAFGIVSPIAGRLTSFGVRRIMMAGVLVDLVGMLLALVLCWTVDSLPAAWLLPSLLLVGIGMGLFMTPILNAVMSGIHDRHVGSAAGVLTTMQRGGNALGCGGTGGPFLSDAFWVRIKRPQPDGILCPGVWCGRLLERTDAARSRRAASTSA